MTELLDLYDRNEQRTGGSIVRGTPVPEGCCLLLVSIMTVRSDGKILITKRAPEKSYAGRWEITGGCVQSGESAEEGAVRELREETGIRIEQSELIPCGVQHRSGYIHRFFLIHKDIAEDAVQLQAGETEAYQWVTPAEFLALASAKCMIPHHISMLLSHYGEIFKDIKEPRKHS